jgi:hypothetical protein
MFSAPPDRTSKSVAAALARLSGNDERLDKQGGSAVNKPWLAVSITVVGVAGLGLEARVLGQTFEQDTTITGPRGRSIQRKVEVQRGPGTINREIQVTRPGGTITRDVQISRTPVGRGFFPAAWPRPVWLPRPVVLGSAGPAFGLGLAAAPVLNFSFGGGGGGPGAIAGGPLPGPGVPGAPGPGGTPVPPPPDEVALMTQRLQSIHVSARKDAAYNLGRLGDPRAIPSLLHVLKYDNWKDVRVASAIALGEIGGNESAVALERCAIYDHKEDVRKAATNALARLNAKAKLAAASVPAGAPVGIPAPPPSSAVPPPFRGSANAPDVPPANEAPSQGELNPPPPPSPVTGGPGGN